MILPDVNVLVYAFRSDAVNHVRMKRWLEEAISAGETYGVSDQVLAGFVRVVTHPRVFAEPAPLAPALAFANALRRRENAVAVAPGPRHWEIFDGLCRAGKAPGNLVPDAWFAALAIESACEWVTTDRDYARFPGLRWRHPFEPGPRRRRT